MALNSLIDTLIDYVGYGAIIGNEGSVWIETPGFIPIQSEISQLVKVFKFTKIELDRGLLFQKQRFMIIDQSDDTIVAQNANGMLVLYKCNSCFILSYLETDEISQKCIHATVELGQKVNKLPANDL